MSSFYRNRRRRETAMRLQRLPETECGFQQVSTLAFQAQRKIVERVLRHSGNSMRQSGRLLDWQSFVEQQLQDALGIALVGGRRHTRNHQHELAALAIGVFPQPFGRFTERAGMNALEEFGQLTRQNQGTRRA